VWDAETWENSPTQKWFWNCHPLILNPVQSDRHVIDTIFGLVLHLFNLIHSTGFFWMDGVLRPRAHAFLHSLVSLRIQLYSLISLLAVSVVVLNALRSHSNFYSVTIYLSKSSRSVLVRLFPYMLIKCVWSLYGRFWPTSLFYWHCSLGMLYNAFSLAPFAQMKLRCASIHLSITFFRLMSASVCTIDYGSS